MTVALYPLPKDFPALSDDCAECHGEYVAVNGEPCPGCGGDSENVLLAQLEALRRTDEVQSTALHLARRIREFEAEADVLQRHVDSVSLRLRSRVKTVAFLKRWLQQEMEAAAVTKVKDEFVTVYLQDNPPSVEVVDDQQLAAEHKRATLKMPLLDVPDELKEFVTSTDTLLTGLKNYIEETGHVPAGAVYHGKGAKRHLRIR